MMAALFAARAGCAVDLFEKNEKLGKKIYITGKGRCNFTNGCESGELTGCVCRNPRFLYSAFAAFSNRDVIALFEELGMKTKEERGRRMFPASDHASDVTKALESELKRNGVRVRLGEKVLELRAKKTENSLEDTPERQGEPDIKILGIVTDRSGFLEYDAVIVATGGLSYPSTGSTGDGIRFAQQLGLKTKTPVPSLVPLEVAENDAAMLQGLSLKNVSLSLRKKKKILYEEQGEMLFTHFGISGPLVLTASTMIPDSGTEELTVHIDLKPALESEVLDRRFIRECEAAPNRQLANILPSVYPARMVPVIMARCGIPAERKARDLTRKERTSLVETTKDLVFHVTGTRGFSEAIITRGGVDVRGINPATMESKKIKGLFFAGEVLDVDAKTGGFNLQIAWSTGAAAGRAAAQPEAQGEQLSEAE